MSDNLYAAKKTGCFCKCKRRESAEDVVANNNMLSICVLNKTFPPFSLSFLSLFFSSRTRPTCCSFVVVAVWGFAKKAWLLSLGWVSL